MVKHPTALITPIIVRTLTLTSANSSSYAERQQGDERLQLSNRCWQGWMDQTTVTRQPSLARDIEMPVQLSTVQLLTSATADSSSYAERQQGDARLQRPNCCCQGCMG